MEIIRARRKIVVLQRNGFTLIELLVVIGIIAVLFAVVLIAINPAKRFAEANNARRQSDVRSISDAIAQYITDKRGQTPDYIPETPTCIGNGETLNGNGGREVDPVRDSSGLVGLWHFNANEGKELSDSDLEIHNNAVSLWHFNEGTGQTTADSKGALVGTLGSTSGPDGNDPSWSTFGRFGNAFSFTDDWLNYLSLGDSDSVDFGAGDFTLEAWVKLNSTSQLPQTGQEAIIGKDDGASNRQFFLVTDANSDDWHNLRVGYYTSNGLVSTTTNTSAINNTNWYHIAGVRSGNNLLIYVNGTTQSVTSNGGVAGSMNATSAELTIGSRSGGNYFNGRIDEVVIYNSALDANIIKEHYDRRIVNDNSVGLNNSNIGSSASSIGRFGEALWFDGVNDYIRINNSASLENATDSSFTISTWTKPQDVPPTTCGVDNNTCRYGIFIRPGYHTGIVYGNNKKFRAEIFNSANTSFVLSSSEFEAGNWHNLIMSVDDAAKMRYFYIDGQSVNGSPASYSGTLRDYGTGSYYIGAAAPFSGSNEWHLKGLIDEVAIWNQSITDINKIKEYSVLCYDLSSYLVPEYLGSIPKDPKTGADADTGYTISKDTGGAITVQAISPEAIDNQTPEIKASR